MIEKHSKILVSLMDTLFNAGYKLLRVLICRREIELMLT